MKQDSQVNIKCNSAHLHASRCKTKKIGRKIRQGQPRGGSPPLPAPTKHPMKICHLELGGLSVRPSQ